MSDARVANGVPTLFALVFVIWAGCYLAGVRGDEPFPALIQPGFGYVLDDEDQVEWVDTRYAVEFAGGGVEEVDYHDLLPDAGASADVMAFKVFSDEAVEDPETAAWVRDRLDELGYDGDPVRLTVTLVEVTADTETDQRTEGKTKDVAEVDLR